MTEPMRWAILGTGKIANRFAYALNNIPERAELLAVGSRSQESGGAFARKHIIPRVHVGYENVVADPEVDIVYIGTPGVFHLRDIKMCLEAGKHVLCEKVITMNAAQTEEVIRLAREKNLFLMEAMWTRFFPIHIRVRELLAEGAIGEVLGMDARFIATVPYDLNNRFFDVSLGAGVLLDLGSYGIAWAYSVLGTPEAVTGLTHFGESGADYQSGIVFMTASGQIATIHNCQVGYDSKEAVVFGTEGKIDLHAPWYKPTAMTVHIAGKEPELVEMPLGSFNGYEYEAIEVMECIQAGKTESDVIPLNESLAIVKTLDDLREQWGITYPSER